MAGAGLVGVGDGFAGLAVGDRLGVAADT